MKKKDIGVIFLVSVISAVMSIILSGMLLTPPEGRQQQVEVVPVIVPEISTVDSRYFNANSVNPAQDIEIGRDPTSNPFRGQ